MEMEIMVVPFHGQGHILPSAQLSLHLAQRNVHATLLLPWTSQPSPPIPHHRLLRVARLPPSSKPHDLNDDAFAAYLSDPPRPACVVLDVMMSRLAPVFRRFGVPVVCLFTSGAFSAAANHAVFSRQDGDKVEITAYPDLPDDLIADLADLFLLRRHHPPPPPPHGGGSGDIRRLGPPPGSPPPWLDNAEGSVGVLVNTTLDLEGPFLDYVARAVGKPVWGVGPLLPARLWSPSPSHGDGESAAAIRSWLDSKPAGSVVYVAFGTEVSPSQSELRELAAALEESNQFYIWARRRRVDHHARGPPPPQPNTGLEEEDVVKEGKGMVVRGWAPQLMILRHPSTGVFVSHCGWNSTVEAMACGVPMLCWPIRGDQPYNARLIAGKLRVGHMVARAGGGEVRKEGIVRGIEKVLGASDARERAAEIGRRLETGFLTSSSSSLDAFCEFINRELVDESKAWPTSLKRERLFIS